MRSQKNRGKVGREISTRQNEEKYTLCCAHSAPTTYLGVTRHIWTHFSPPSCDRKQKGGGRLIKTRRAVSDCIGVSKTHTDPCSCPHKHTHWCLYSFRLSHSHTPKRSHFLCQPAKLQLSFFLSISLFLPLCLRDGQQQRHMFGMLSLSRSRPDSNTKPVSEEVWEDMHTRCAA